MKTVLITGSDGFVGKNLVSALVMRKDVLIKTFTSKDGQQTLEAAIEEADIIYHLAGINRPETDDEFQEHILNTAKSLLNSIDKTAKGNYNDASDIAKMTKAVCDLQTTFFGKEDKGGTVIMTNQLSMFKGML